MVKEVNQLERNGCEWEVGERPYNLTDTRELGCNNNMIKGKTENTAQGRTGL